MNHIYINYNNKRLCILPEFNGGKRRKKKRLIQKPSENIHAMVDIDTQTFFLFERRERK